MKYSFKCPDPCSFMVNVKASTKQEAIEKVMPAGRVHFKMAHPEKQISDEQLKALLDSGTRQE